MFSLNLNVVKQLYTITPIAIVGILLMDTRFTLGFSQETVDQVDSATSNSALVTSPTAVASPPTPSPSKKKRKKSNVILDFLREEGEKEQRRHEESEEKTERFLVLFARKCNHILSTMRCLACYFLLFLLLPHLFYFFVFFLLCFSMLLFLYIFV